MRASYPLLDLFWTMLVVLMFIIWIWLLIIIFSDIFRSHDMRGESKALWVIFVIIIPLLGILIYLIARGSGMHDRAEQAMKSQKQAFDAQVRVAAGTGSTADDLVKLADLKSQGVITDQEFEAQKAKILAS